MVEQTLLSDLCSICYTEPPKYRCPRCAARTCSLQCYKRHQQRASCNGKRDPAAFIKKSQLSTAEGIDRDYNFLTSVERAIDRADRDAEDRGTISKPTHSRDAWHSNGPLQRYLQANSIIVDRAPKGMSRQNANNTRSTNSRNISWTVEWVDATGERAVNHDNLGSTTLTELYGRRQAEKRNAANRKWEQEREAARLKANRPSNSELRLQRKKRKIEGLDVTQGVRATDLLKRQRVDVEEIKWEEEPRMSSSPTLGLGGDPSQWSGSKNQALASELDKDVKITEAGADSDEKDLAPEHEDGPVQDSASITQQTSSSSRSSLTPSRNIVKEPPSQERQLSLARDHPRLKDEESTFHFYLLKPHTTSKSRVLVPLSSESTLTESLRGQVVLEFPTVYVLREASDLLPAGFELEERYLQAKREEDAELEGLMRSIEPKGGIWEEKELTPATELLDETAILEMLRRDVRG